MRPWRVALDRPNNAEGEDDPVVPFFRVAGDCAMDRRHSQHAILILLGVDSAGEPHSELSRKRILHVVDVVEVRKLRVLNAVDVDDAWTVDTVPRQCSELTDLLIGERAS